MNRCSVNNSLLSTSPTCEPWTTSSHAVALAVGSMNESGETTLHLQGVRTGDSGKRGPIFQNDTELQTGIVGKRVRLSALYDISTRVRYALGYARAPGRRLWPLQNAQKSQWSHTCDEITANHCKSHGLRCIWREMLLLPKIHNQATPRGHRHRNRDTQTTDRGHEHTKQATGQVRGHTQHSPLRILLPRYSSHRLLSIPLWARCVNRWHIHVTFGSKRSDGSEVRALEGARMRHQRPCRRAPDGSDGPLLRGEGDSGKEIARPTFVAQSVVQHVLSAAA